ncbi:MAG TPA: isopentenyl-diphosphate Delta-isomerase [Candidatus Bathyarchaeia archaeon]|nr:isopentenyl-diphosphate Delta-isomerase [Candidatus Bathyarchaeia archaeon]
MTKVISVDQNDRFLGFEDKIKVHQGKGILHRAFSVLVVNNKGEILLQKRSKYKLLWPLFWSNTCCSHPVFSRHPELVSGSIISQAKKRLREEMGFTVSLKPLFRFQYKASYKNIGSENELVTVLLGKYDGQDIRPDTKEVVEFKWVKYDDLLEDIAKRQSLYTPWFRKMVNNKKLRDVIIRQLAD